MHYIPLRQQSPLQDARFFLSLIAELEFELDVERILITCVESVLKVNKN